MSGEESKAETVPPPGDEPAASEGARSSSATLHHHVVPTERCGALNVYVQGDLEEAHKDKDSKCVFLTVHDVCSNHLTIMKFVDNECFEEIKKRSIFVHVVLPGHEEGGEDLPDGYQFPTIQHLGEDLVTVLDQLRIKYVIGLGDGAGANILARFGIMHSARCLGILLLHPTSNKATMVNNFKDKVSKWKVKNFNPSGENLAIFRRFGHKLEEAEDKEKAMEELKMKLGLLINKKNMKYYLDAYSNRTDITPQLKNLKCDALLIVGSKMSHVAAAEHMHQAMDKTKTSLLKIDDVGNVLDEAPVKLANAILLFCKGLGWLTSVKMPGASQRKSSIDSQGKPVRQRSISMEDYDKPNIRRLSISSKGD